MSIEIRIGNSIHVIPEEGNNKWGEETTATLVALATALQDVVGPQDIVTKESILANGTLTRTPINGFKFDTSLVQSIDATAVIVRIYPDILALEPKKDTVIIDASAYDGTVDYAVRYVGNDAGVTIFVRDDGQFEYTSIDDPLTSSILIKFKGSAIVQTGS